MVGEPPVDLLRHPRVEAAQPGLDVGHGDVELGRGQGSGQGGVGVAEDDHQRGRRSPRSPPPAPPACGPVIRPWEPEPMPRWRSGRGRDELLEEGVRHRAVVVLAGVDDHLAHVAPQRAGERPQLDELRPGADDGQDSARGSGQYVGDGGLGRRGGRRAGGAGRHRDVALRANAAASDGFSGPMRRGAGLARLLGLRDSGDGGTLAPRTSGSASSALARRRPPVGTRRSPRGRAARRRRRRAATPAPAPTIISVSTSVPERVEHERVVEPQPLEDAEDGLRRGPAAELDGDRGAGRRALVDDLHARLAREAVEHLRDAGPGRR